MTKTRRPAGSRATPFTNSAEDCLVGGTEDIGSLKEEMEEWASNMESNSMEHLPKYDEVNETKDALENAHSGLELLTVPDALAKVMVTYTMDTRRKAQSRAARLDNACAPLDGVLDAARAWLEGNEHGSDGYDEVDQFADDLENALDEARNVSFPGMY